MQGSPHMPTILALDLLHVGPPAGLAPAGVEDMENCRTSDSPTSTNLSINGRDYLPWPVLVTLSR